MRGHGREHDWRAQAHHRRRGGHAVAAHVQPEVLEGTGAYDTEEGCLSLPGTRPCTRFRTIRVRYLDERGHERTGSFSGYMAQIIQHEVDHTNGILI